MVERAFLIIRAIYDRVIAHAFWAAVNTPRPEALLAHVVLSKNCIPMKVLNWPNSREAEFARKPPMFWVSAGKAGGWDTEGLMQEWQNYQVLGKVRDDLTNDTGHLTMIKKTGERLMKGAQLLRKYQRGDKIEIKSKSGKWLEMYILGRKDNGLSEAYEARSPLGTRATDAPSRNVRPHVSTAEMRDIPDTAETERWGELADEQTDAYEALEERDPVGDRSYTMAPAEFGEVKRPRCKKRGETRRVLKEAELGDKFECREVEGHCTQPGDDVMLRLGYGVRPRRVKAQGGKAKGPAPLHTVEEEEVALPEPSSDEEESEAEDNEEIEGQLSQEPELVEGVDYVVTPAGGVGVSSPLKAFFGAYVKTDAGAIQEEADASEKMAFQVTPLAGDNPEKRLLFYRQPKGYKNHARLEMRETQGLYKLLRGKNRTARAGENAAEWNTYKNASGEPFAHQQVRIRRTGTKFRLHCKETETGEVVIVNPNTGLRKGAVDHEGGEGYVTKGKTEAAMVFSTAQMEALKEEELGELGNNVDGEVRMRIENLPGGLVEKLKGEGKCCNAERGILVQGGYEKYARRAAMKELKGLLKTQAAGYAVAKPASDERRQECEKLGNRTLRTKALFDLENVRTENGNWAAELKMRLAPGGFLMERHPDQSSGTASAELARILLARAATMARPVIVAGGIKRAFNMSNALEAHKRPCVRYPHNLPEDELELEDGLQEDVQWKAGSLMEVAVSLYGMRDAGSEFFRSLEKHLYPAGLTKSELAPALYRSQSGTIFVLSHVDDLLILGEDIREVHKMVKEVEKRFPFKAWGFVGKTPVQFCGKDIAMEPDEHGTEVIIVRMGTKVEGTKETEYPEGAGPDRELTTEELRRWQAAYGSLLWLGGYRLGLGFCPKHSVPRRAAAESKLANQAIGCAKTMGSAVGTYRCGTGKVKLLTHTDASLQLQHHIDPVDRELQLGKPIGGTVTGLVKESVGATKDKSFGWNLTSFGSYRVEKRALSSYAAEGENCRVCLNKTNFVLALLELVLTQPIENEVGADPLPLVRRTNSRSGIRMRDCEVAATLLAIKGEYRARRFAIHFITDQDNCRGGPTKLTTGPKLSVIQELTSTERHHKFLGGKDSEGHGKRLKYEGEPVEDWEGEWQWVEERDGKSWDNDRWAKDVKESLK